MSDKLTGIQKNKSENVQRRDFSDLRYDLSFENAEKWRSLGWDVRGSKTDAGSFNLIDGPMDTYIDDNFGLLNHTSGLSLREGRNNSLIGASVEFFDGIDIHTLVHIGELFAEGLVYFRNNTED